MSESHQAIIVAPFGAIELRVQRDRLVSVDFLYCTRAERVDDHPVLQSLVDQVRQYFTGNPCELNAPMMWQGTAFQQRVWQALLVIPFGEVRTYGQLAKQLDSSARAVGGACRANPVPLFVPCHRVVAAAGIGGFSGATEGDELRAKRWLLEHEGIRF